MADWQIKYKNKVLIRKRNKKTFATEQTAVLSIIALRHYLPQTVCFSQNYRFPQFTGVKKCVIAVVYTCVTGCVIVVVYTCVIRCVIVVVYTCVIRCVIVVVYTCVIRCVIVVYACVIRCVIVVVYTCVIRCYCCGVHVWCKVCYCCGTHMCFKVCYANTLLLLVSITSVRGRTRSRLLLLQADGYWRRSNSAVVRNIMQSCTLLLMTTQKP